MTTGSILPSEQSEPAGSPADVPAPHARRNAILRAVGLIAVVLAWLGIAGVGGPAIGSLSTVQSNDQESFLPSGAESVLAANAAAEFDDSGELPAFVIFETGGEAATPDQLAAWQGFTQTLATQPVSAEDPSLGSIGDYSSNKRVGRRSPPDAELIMVVGVRLVFGDPVWECRGALRWVRPAWLVLRASGSLVLGA